MLCTLSCSPHWQVIIVWPRRWIHFCFWLVHQCWNDEASWSSDELLCCTHHPLPRVWQKKIIEDKTWIFHGQRCWIFFSKMQLDCPVACEEVCASKNIKTQNFSSIFRTEHYKRLSSFSTPWVMRISVVVEINWSERLYSFFFFFFVFVCPTFHLPRDGHA